MLKGRAKTDYQRGYMREYMRNLRSKGKVLRPNVKTHSAVVEGELEFEGGWMDADGNAVYEE